MNKLILKCFFIIVTCFLNISISYCNDETMQKISHFLIDKTEVTIGKFKVYAKETNFISMAEKNGGGLVYENGWVKKIDWNWKRPYGLSALDNEPVVHINFNEAENYCKWNKKRIPTLKEWELAAYTEFRPNNKDGYKFKKSYPYPTGENTLGLNCLNDCNFNYPSKYSKLLLRGYGHVSTFSTTNGINGLYDMGGNVWEWVDIKNNSYKGTKGGSWWYGKKQMIRGYAATKPKNMSALYIGFRCVKDFKN